MKAGLVLCLLVVLALTSSAGVAPANHGSRYVAPSVEAVGDTIFIPGDVLPANTNAGSLENTINGDTLSGGVRKNANRVYALNMGQAYFQQAPITVQNPTGVLTICAVPSASGTTKPVILISPVPPATTVSTAAGATVNIVYGSLKLEGIHYQAQQLTGNTTNELFMCGTANQLPQSLVVNNCLFEFGNIDLFDCTNETGAIGGWPYGAKFRFTNSYFRNLFFAGQWWDSRIFQCKHPTDTLWVENCTVTTGGLTFLQQNQLTDFMYINHNTIVNNKKYWLLSPYHKSLFITNNIFINQDWVGEDTNVTNSGQDPDKLFMSTINVDTNNATNGLIVQGKYYAGDSSHYVAALDLNKLQVYVSDNINYYDPLLLSGYYNSDKYKLASIGTLPSSLNWAGAGTGPWKIGNTPGEWMNSRTLAFFAAYGPGHGGFIEMRTSTADPGTVTKGIFDASVVDSMAVWNQNQWGDSRFPSQSAMYTTKYIYGDHDPQTIPGNKTEDGTGITKFTDLTESFNQTGHVSEIDQLPIGSLIWDDAKLAAYSSAAAWNAVYIKYVAEGGLTGVASNSTSPLSYDLSQNYPNPFNPTTTINFTLPKATNVDLKVFNVLGQEVAALAHGVLAAGQHTVEFKAANLASGLYFYRLNAGEFSSVKKMMLVK